MKKHKQSRVECRAQVEERRDTKGKIGVERGGIG